ncbi:adaptor protein MecA [Butyrivibrio sp. MC2013]|uniref:adaptor protein MecA n=1 Tax=Butyrivibrio sp. MC2013 TaxID=1280686 RepID=UPI0018CACA5A|nr:adaptor protein MecA [Butyrivibrio sp. MC2013]
MSTIVPESDFTDEFLLTSAGGNGGTDMKIEKVNDHQIRCTLTKEDLARRQLKVSELAYGTEKARELFQEMMDQANTRFGFNSEDVPLMIEAIPINSECIVLVITKSEDPEELDTRFSQFGPSVSDANSSYENNETDFADSAYEDEESEVMDLFQKLQDGDFSGFLDDATEKLQKKSSTSSGSSKLSYDKSMTVKCFRLNAMHDVLQLVSVIPSNYEGRSTLFRDPESGSYLLALYGDPDNRAYINMCRLLGEYSHEDNTIRRSPDYLEEHFPVIIAGHALQKLSEAGSF